jgi:hypothetical protein
MAGASIDIVFPKEKGFCRSARSGEDSGERLGKDRANAGRHPCEMELTSAQDPDLVTPECTEPPWRERSPDSLGVIAWPDPVIDRLGYDPRSAYVERFWLAILGPSTTWLMRRLAAGFDSSPDGFELDLGRTAHSLGLGGKAGRHGPFQRSIGRLVTFELGRVTPAGALAVRRFVPPLPRRHVLRLDPDAQEEHLMWLHSEVRPDPDVARLRWRARRIALGLVALGDSYATVETELLGWHLHPALASDAADWAWRRARQRLSAESP